MKSFGLLRTNTGLSTNMKLIVSDKYDLYLESIDSATELSASKFKKVRFNKDNYFDEMFPFFYKDLPTEIAFSIKYKDDNDNLLNTYADQYDDIYQMGARNIIDNKNYSEEYEFFAPLYFSKGNFPKYFAIFRVDGPGLIDLSSSNFKSEILNKLKCIKLIDMTKNSVLGEWIDRNFVRNNLFPDTPLEVDFRTDEFTKWNGIDYESGGYTHKSLFMNENFEYENAIFDLEKFIFDGYHKNKIVFPNIINFSFLFDDTPASPTSLRKWSINRYFGFYLEDIDQISVISPYDPPKLKSDVYIDPLNKNTLRSKSSTYPFDDHKSDLDFHQRDYYVEYLGNFYKVEQYEEVQLKSITPVVVPNEVVSSDLLPSEHLPGKRGSKPPVSKKKGTKVATYEQFRTSTINRYRIIADIDLSGKESFLNRNVCLFDELNYIKRFFDGSYFDIAEFDTADVWMVEIDGKYHSLVKDSIGIKVNTDYGFSFSIEKYSYFINNSDSSYTKTVSLIVDKNNKPKIFKIFRVRFSDIKDFDTSIIDTEFSKYEYEKLDELTKTDETKLYFPDLRSKSYPNDIDDYLYKGEVVHIPTSSEYTSNLETFRVVNKDLSDIWRKNPVYARWGYQNSLSANDYPYLLNNSEIFEDYNRTVNPFSPLPSRFDRNLDYFYTINSSTSSYIHHSLHVEDHIKHSINKNFRFELDKYLNTGTYSNGTMSATYSFDYFSYFFGKKTEFKNGDIIKNTTKYSLFNKGDNDIPNVTLFRGIKLSIFDIDNIKYDNGVLTNINLKNANTFDDYKFSILLSDNKTPSISSSCYSFETVASPFPVIGTAMIVYTQFSNISIGDEVIIESSCEFAQNLYIGSKYDNSGDTIVLLVYSNGDPYDMPLGCNGNICLQHINLSNEMDWLIVDEWDSRQVYASGSVVVHDDILYQSTTKVGPVDLIVNDFVTPFVYSEWLSYTHSAGVTYSLLWNPNFDSLYLNGSVVYNSGEYYRKVNSPGLTVSFWNPYSIYATGSIVLYKNDFWISTSGQSKRPSTVTRSRVSDTQHWQKVTGYESICSWKLINLWDISKTYSTLDLVVQDHVVYRCIITSTGNIVSNTKYWKRVSSIIPDTNIIYQSNNNPVILMNDKYYIIRKNDTESTLKNGIDIYINHKWKNILINIAIDDNTIKNISETDRDDLYSFALYQRDKIYSDGLYSPVNTKLTANNFIHCINDITNTYGFTDLLTYTIIDHDSKTGKDTIKTYDYDNLLGLDHLIKCDFPDEFNIKVD